MIQVYGKGSPYLTKSPGDGGAAAAYLLITYGNPVVKLYGSGSPYLSISPPAEKKESLVNGHVLLEWKFSVWAHSSSMRIQSMPTFDWNGDSFYGHILVE